MMENEGDEMSKLSIAVHELSTSLDSDQIGSDLLQITSASLSELIRKREESHKKIKRLQKSILSRDVVGSFVEAILAPGGDAVAHIDDSFEAPNNAKAVVAEGVRENSEEVDLLCRTCSSFACRGCLPQPVLEHAPVEPHSIYRNGDLGELASDAAVAQKKIHPRSEERQGVLDCRIHPLAIDAPEALVAHTRSSVVDVVQPSSQLVVYPLRSCQVVNTDRLEDVPPTTAKGSPNSFDQAAPLRLNSLATCDSFTIYPLEPATVEIVKLERSFTRHDGRLRKNSYALISDQLFGAEVVGDDECVYSDACLSKVTDLLPWYDLLEFPRRTLSLFEGLPLASDSIESLRSAGASQFSCDVVAGDSAGVDNHHPTTSYSPNSARNLSSFGNSEKQFAVEVPGLWSSGGPSRPGAPSGIPLRRPVVDSTSFRLVNTKVATTAPSLNPPAPIDELDVYLDLIALSLREASMRDERIKLDVVIALKRKLLEFHGGNSIEAIPRQALEQLSEFICELVSREVARARTGLESELASLKDAYDKVVQERALEKDSLAADNVKLSKQCEQLKGNLLNLQQLKTNLREKEERLRELERLSANYETEVSSLKDLVQHVEKENERLCEDLNCGRLKIEKLHEEQRLHAKQCSAAQRDLIVEKSALLSENENLNVELTKLRSDLRKVEEDRARLQVSREADSSIIKHLEEKLKRNTDLQGKTNREIASYFEESLRLGEKAKKYKGQLESCLRKVEEYRGKQEILERKNGELSATVQRLLSERNSHRPGKEDLEIKAHLRKADVEDANVNGKGVGTWRPSQAFDRAAPQNTRKKLQKVDLPMPGISSHDRVASLLNDSPHSDHVASLLHSSAFVLKSPLISTSNAIENSRVPPVKGAPADLQKPLPIDLPSNFTDMRKPESLASANTEIVSAAVQIPFKYSSEETKLFLKEMTYKLERTEASIKFADLSNPKASLEAGKYLEKQVKDLRSDILSFRTSLGHSTDRLATGVTSFVVC